MSEQEDIRRVAEGHALSALASVAFDTIEQCNSALTSLTEGFLTAILDAKAGEREACIQECEAQKVLFLSPQYASSQPVGSICERFAVDECIAAIRKRSDAACPHPLPSLS